MDSDTAVRARDDVANLALSGALHSRVIDAVEAVYDGYGYGLRLFHASHPVAGFDAILAHVPHLI